MPPLAAACAVEVVGGLCRVLDLLAVLVDALGALVGARAGLVEVALVGAQLVVEVNEVGFRLFQLPLGSA